jgi:surface protein
MSYAALYKGTTPVIYLEAGSESGTPWVRNPAWLTLPVLGVSDQRMVGLLAVTNDDSNYIALSCAGNYTVDWGDGVTENFASGAVAQHLYTYSAISASTEYTITTGVVARQVVVSVTPQAGSNLTTVDFQQKHTRTNLQLYNSNWLDIAVNSPNMTSLVLGHPTTNVVNLVWVEKVNVGVVGTVTSFNFRAFRLLRSVIISNTINFTSTANMFASCNSIQSVPLFNTASVTTMNLMFDTCRSLQSVPLFNTASVTNMTDMFSNCSSLKSVPLFNTTMVDEVRGMFANCSSLISVPPLDLSRIVFFDRMFQNCFSLQSVPFFKTAPVVESTTSMFAGCNSLKNIPRFKMQISIYSNLMFQNCFSLQSIDIDFSGTYQSYNKTSMFSGCRSLVSIPPIGAAAGSSAIDNINIFSACPSLSSGYIQGFTTSHSYANCKFSRTGLVAIFTNLGTADSGAIITITGNHGVADLTAADRLIATNKGWTITS